MLGLENEGVLIWWLVGWWAQALFIARRREASKVPPFYDKTNRNSNQDIGQAGRSRSITQLVTCIS